MASRKAARLRRNIPTDLDGMYVRGTVSAPDVRKWQRTLPKDVRSPEEVDLESQIAQHEQAGVDSGPEYEALVERRERLDDERIEAMAVDCDKACRSAMDRFFVNEDGDTFEHDDEPYTTLNLAELVRALTEALDPSGKVSSATDRTPPTSDSPPSS